MSPVLQQLQETIDYIKTRHTQIPEAGIILGSGLGNFLSEIEVEVEIPYEDIIHFPVSTVEGHGGKLVFGKLYGKNLVVMAGRFHFYEGYTPQQVAYPIRVLKMLGISTLLISNAAGGVGEGFKVGDLMMITDHISFFINNPLIGKNDDHIGMRFPDMSEPYNKELAQKAREVASSLNINLKEGVYTGVTGPTFETRSEYRLIKLLGGDAVGMSTVQEVITAVHAGLKVFAVSVISDIGIRDEENTITHAEVLQAASEAEPRLTSLFKEMVRVI